MKKAEKASPSADDLMQALMDIWQTGKTGNLSDILDRNIVYEDVSNDQAYTGLEEVSSFVDFVHDWTEDLELQVLNLESNRSGASAEWVMTARQARPIGARVRVGTNRRIRLRGVTLIQIKKGRIVRASDYLDSLTLLRQLGGHMDLPGGASLGPIAID